MIRFQFLLLLFTVFYSAWSSATTMREEVVCQAVLNHANADTLDTITIPFDWPSTDDGKALAAHQLFGETAKVDINDDGKIDSILRTEGAMYAGSFYVFDDQWSPIKIRKSPTDNWESDNLRSALDVRLVRYQGRIYILGSTGKWLHYISYINRNNVEHVMCEFSQERTSTGKLFRSKNDRICEAVLKRRLVYPEFDHLHALTFEDATQAGAVLQPSDRAVRIDIDNDGTQDLVVQIRVESGAGRGCSGISLGVLNKTRNGLDKKRTELMPETRCGGETDWPFLYEGMAYVERKLSTEYPMTINVSRIKNSVREVICEFAVLNQDGIPVLPTGTR